MGHEGGGGSSSSAAMAKSINRQQLVVTLNVNIVVLCYQKSDIGIEYNDLITHLGNQVNYDAINIVFQWRIGWIGIDPSERPPPHRSQTI